MFGFFKRRGVENAVEGHPVVEQEEGKPIIGFVIHKSAESPLEGIRRGLEGTRFNGLAAKGVEMGEKGLTFELGDDLVAISHMPAAYPSAEMIRHAEQSWLFKGESVEGLKGHGSFTIVAIMKGRSSRVNRLLTATQLTALVGSGRDVLAVYWASAELVVLPEVFVNFAREFRSAEAPPVYLWVNMRCGGNADGSTVLATKGMVSLGHMEIEIPSIRKSPGELREWLVNIVMYLIEKGPVLLDGQTIGPDKDSEMRIRHLPSLYGSPGTTIRLTELK